MITGSAPGKVVLWGEYAVLTGAPALVLAVDRYAHCTITPGGDVWRFSATGHRAPDVSIGRQQLLGAEPPAADAVWAIAWHVLQALDATELPTGGAVRFDTEAFSLPDVGKLGLGSSAALCTAACAAFARLLDRPPSFDRALEAHASWQGGHGSGIDVAAAWHGGLLRFQRAADTGAVTAAPWPLPSDLLIRFVFSGRSARTRDHLERLRRWQRAGGRLELDALARAAAALFETMQPLDALDAYAAALERLDRAAGLGIFSEPHRRLALLARTAGVVYKPCGAGGGDIGAAFACDAAAADRFSRLAADHGFLPLALETAPHGIEVTG